MTRFPDRPRLIDGGFRSVADGPGTPPRSVGLSRAARLREPREVDRREVASLFVSREVTMLQTVAGMAETGRWEIAMRERSARKERLEPGDAGGGRYVNRKGEEYFLFEGRTKTGKPKYFCSRKEAAKGDRLAEMPADYEWRESPQDAVVSVRKQRETLISDGEQAAVAEAIRSLAELSTFFVDIDGPALIVYLPDRDPGDVDRLMQLLGVPLSESMGSWTAAHGRYSPTYRFELVDREQRLFTIERWCYRSWVDGWRLLSSGAPLSRHLEKYVPHLGQESYFDLM